MPSSRTALGAPYFLKVYGLTACPRSLGHAPTGASRHLPGERGGELAGLEQDQGRRPKQNDPQHGKSDEEHTGSDAELDQATHRPHGARLALQRR